MQKINAVRGVRQPTSRFLQAIGIEPYPSTGSSSSNLFDEPWYGSVYHSNDDDDDDDETYYDDDDDDDETEYGY